jgi:ABC-type uncharacterized transport system ATPase subunit
MSILIGKFAFFSFLSFIPVLEHVTNRPTHRRMHQISDGERRRVQLCMGLMGQWDVLLLDEVTVDLDVLVRSELLAFLIKESEERGATIVCESHDFLRE